VNRVRKSEFLQALNQPVTYLGLAMLGGIFLTLSYLIVQDRKHEFDDYARHGENLARLFEQSVARTFQSADNTILLLRRSYQQDPDKIDLVAWATDPELKNDLTFQFSILDRDGLVKSSSYGTEVRGLDISGQEHFRAHVGATDDRLYISKPVTLKTSGKRAIILSRRLTAPDGSFDGVLSVSLDFEQLEKLYRSIDLGPSGTAALVGTDGIVRMRVVNGEVDWTNTGRQISPGQGVLGYAERARSGSYWNTPGLLDDARRQVSFRVLDQFPLIALVSIAEAEVLQHATRHARIYWGIASSLTVAILIAIAAGAMRERKLMAATREITRRAFHDGLTGLANRALFRQKLEYGLVQLENSKSRLNILVLDLDNFKTVNDTLGHAAGDDLIQQVGCRLQAAVRETDLVARLGGDEFAILQPARADHRDTAIILANRIIDVIGKPYDLDGHQAVVGTSIGIVLASGGDENADQLLRNADLALYRAKSDGRNTFRFFEAEVETEMRERYELEIDLRNAIGRDELEIYYQPLIDVAGRQICGIEALLRWNHPRRGVITPDTFIPIAESTGLIVQLGAWMLRRATMQAIEWPPHVKLAVNLSPLQFRKGDIVGAVSDALLRCGLAAERLELEITESVLLQKDDATLAKLHELKSLGASIVLDDFGTGYSSLSYLQAFPFDKLKIDRSFIAGIAKRPDCAAIVCAVTGLAKSLNVTTTAEGIETMQQFELLRVAGCDQAQGFLFGHPCQASEIQFGQDWERRREGAAA
jgi:diguanylate cyclase (GGDEF)-like protein